MIGECKARHRAQEFIEFLSRLEGQTPSGLQLHLIVDHSSTHKTAEVHHWLARHPRFHLHFTPTSSSWLNLVERWFGEITRKRIRRGTFTSVKALTAAIEEFLIVYNQNPIKFVWTKDADMIPGKIQHCKEALVTPH